MIYNVNIGIGWASSGVEYAQAYRARLFRLLGLDARFIFTDFFPFENVEHFTYALGLEDREVIWLYQSFTDQETARCSHLASDFEKSLEGGGFDKEEKEEFIRYKLKGSDIHVDAYFSLGLKKSGIDGDYKKYVRRADFYSGGVIVRRDHFVSRLLFSEYFAIEGGGSNVRARRFFNLDGTEALFEAVIDENESVYRLPGRLVYGKQELIAEMISRLALTSADVVIMDRASEAGQAVLRNRKGARVYTVLHAEHYSKTHVGREILWNNYYDYEFTNADSISGFISSTRAQADLLASQMESVGKKRPLSVCIPVGSLDALRRPEKPRKRHSLMTASRLATEKHVDWLVRAVAEARKEVPDVSLDIFGKGGEEGRLRGLIEELGAQGFVRLMGHRDLAREYERYEGYASASGSEGFGLTLMEAVGSGLPMIGFDVPYGNQAFIEDGKNGYLLPYHDVEGGRENVRELAGAITRLFTGADARAFSERSYGIASEYLSEKVARKWEELLSGERRQA